MSSCIGALRPDFIIFKAEKRLSALAWVGGRYVTVRAASRMISGKVR